MSKTMIADEMEPTPDEIYAMDIRVVVSGRNVWAAAKDLAKLYNEDVIPYSLGMSGKVTPHQMAEALKQFLPRYLDTVLERRVDNIERYMNESSSDFDGALSRRAH